MKRSGIGPPMIALVVLLSCSPGPEAREPAQPSETASQPATQAVTPAVTPRPLLTDSPALGRGYPVVPERAPDTIPGWVHSAENRGNAVLTCTAVNYVRNVIWVVFEAGTSQSQKQAAVRAVSGQVIGGSSYAGTDGMYFLKIDQGSDGEGLCRAVALLQETQYIQHAGIIDFNFR